METLGKCRKIDLPFRCRFLHQAILGGQKDRAILQWGSSFLVDLLLWKLLVTVEVDLCVFSRVVVFLMIFLFLCIFDQLVLLTNNSSGY